MTSCSPITTTVAQILLTAEDVNDPERRHNIERTLERLLELGAIPIINENDTVSTAEIKVGDNDTLSAIVAVSVQADLLILLSDINGQYTADPHTHPDAKLISVVEHITPEMEAAAGGAGSRQGHRRHDHQAGARPRWPLPTGAHDHRQRRGPPPACTTLWTASP